MSTFPQSLYPIFIKWMPFHIPILTFLYTVMIMKLLNYFQVIQISFDVFAQKHHLLRIIILFLCYQVILIFVIFTYKKVLQLRMQMLKCSGTTSQVQFEKHKKINTQNELNQLYKNKKFIQWKKEQLDKEQHQKTQQRIVYEVMESSSSDQQVERISQHRLATTKKIF